MPDQRIGEVARAFGVNPRTLRYYEALGLLPRPSRSPAGYRLYDDEARHRLAFIATAKSLGLTLREIRQIVGISDRGECPCDSVREMLTDHIRRIDEQIVRLHALRSDLRSILTRPRPGTGNGRADRPHTICPMIEPAEAPRKRMTTGGTRR
jgi:DNA-binding transcriptional MerR regulator